MSGIYIHVPFCKTRCIYCGFYSTTSLDQRSRYVDAVCRELKTRKGYIPSDDIATIYFGGGTPSQLEPCYLRKILDTIYNIYNVREDAEITLEGNPDDMKPEFLNEIRRIGFNRLSMGVQTFSDERLRFLHRRHTSNQALNAVSNAQEAGFENISIDLMFGFPDQTLEQWKSDVDKALTLGVQHLSAYSLQFEDGTLMTRMLDEGKINEVSDELSLQMYEYLLDATENAGFEHYEISNFAQPGKHSRHNSSYWHGIPYLGIGAGAHSFDGNTRQYNPESLSEYIKGIESDNQNVEVEVLTDSERYDEYVFTALRTSDGLSLTKLGDNFGETMRKYCLHNAEKHIMSGKLLLEDDILRLSRSGLFVSNDIMSDLMLVE